MSNNLPQPIQTRLKLLFGKSGVDVTEDMTPDIKSFSYDDKESNEADEISITLKDTDGKWAGSWTPDGGEVVKAYILPGTTQKATGRLYCGKFYVDDIDINISPREVTIKAVSIPLNTTIRRKLKSKAWEAKDLKGIAREIANNAGLKLLFDCESNPQYDRQDQSRESDLKFLSKLCEDAGISIKVTDTQLVLFDQSHYEKKKPIKTLELNKSNILSGNFSAAQSETYKSCVIKYRDPQTRVVHNYTYVDPIADENGQEYSMKARASSLDEAKRLAKAKLRKLNCRKITGNMTVIGDIDLIAGVVIECKGIGKKFNGRYIIETANHTVSGGYTTSLSLRKVNSNY